MVKIKCCKEGLESKGLTMNMGRTKDMCCKDRSGEAKNSGLLPCGQCSKGGRAEVAKHRKSVPLQKCHMGNPW
jgi:hypothetical protein